MKTIKAILLSTLLFLYIFSSISAQVATISPESVGMSSERLVRLENYFKEQIEEGKLVGAVSMVMRKNQLVQYTSFGQNDIEKGTPMQKDAIFYIQSMTKPIISVALMMLYEEGHFELNDRIADHLPQFENMQIAQFDEDGKLLEEAQTERSTITIAQLFSHTAGMLHGLSGADLDKKYAENLYFKPHKNIEDRVNALASMPLVASPGTAWYYSASPDVLALLIEHFSGMNTAEFLQEQLFNPLGMNSTGYNVVKGGADRVAALYVRGRDGKLMQAPRQPPQEGNTIFGGTHGLFSTAGDYMKFAQMMLNGGELDGKRYLSTKTVELMVANHAEDFRGNGEGFGLGFGTRIDLAGGKSLGTVGQFFWSGANNTYFFIDPEEELISVLMMQIAPYNGFYQRKHNHFIYQAIVD